MTTHDLDETHDAHPEWVTERRPCVFCEVLHCGCPHEPTIGANVVLGED